MAKSLAARTFERNVDAARSLFRRSRRAWHDIAALAAEACGDDRELVDRFAAEVGMSGARLRSWLKTFTAYGDRARPDDASLALHEELLRGRSRAEAIAELDQRIATGRHRLDDLRVDEGRSPATIIRGQEVDPEAIAEAVAARPELAEAIAHNAEAAAALDRVARADAGDREAIADDRIREEFDPDWERRGVLLAVHRHLDSARYQLGKAREELETITLDELELGVVNREIARVALVFDWFRTRAASAGRSIDEELAELLAEGGA